MSLCASAQEKKPAAPASAPATPAPASLTQPAKLIEKAPDNFKVKMETTKGDFIIECTRAWAPNGVDRFYNLVKAGYFTDIAMFRAIAGFMVQFGIHGDPKISAAWRDATIQDDPSGLHSNTPGTITFAKRVRDTRTTQLFINFGNNNNLDTIGFPPIGKVIQGIEVVNKINTEYDEGAPKGQGPDQERIQKEGNVYLKKDFPKLDYIKSATLVK